MLPDNNILTTEELLDSPDLDFMIKGIIAKRKLRMDNIEDFLHEVKIRIFKYGTKYGKTLMGAIAFQVCYAHKSYKKKKRYAETEPLSDDYDKAIIDNSFDRIDLLDEIRNIKSVRLHKKERKILNLMLHQDNYTLDQIGKKFKPQISRQYVCEIKASIIKKVREHYGFSL
jgi:hypothetical protein